MDALFGAWLVEDYIGIVIRSSTSRTEAIHVVAHIVVTELADLQVASVKATKAKKQAMAKGKMILT